MTTTQKQKVPTLRFPKFRGEWVTKRLGDACVKIQDGNYGAEYPKPEDYIRGGIPFLTSKAIGGDGRLIEEKIDYISYEKHTSLKKAHLRLYDVLFTNRGANVGTIGFVDNRISHGNIGPQLTLLRANTNVVTPEFLKEVMKSFSVVKQIRSQDSGSAMNFFGIGATSKFIFDSPLVPEQKIIAVFLSSVDTKIEQLDKKRALLEQYKKGMMQKLFSQEVRFNDEQGNEYPDWVEKRLGDVCNVNPKALNLPQEFIYIDLESVVSGSLMKESKIQKSGAPSRAQRFLKKGDVLFQMVRPYQKNNYYFDKEGDYVASTGYAQLRAQGSAKFLYQILHTESFVNKVLARCTGTSYPAINSSDLGKIHFPIPSLSEQKKIADFLSAIDKKIELISSEFEKAKDFKKGLLQQMFI